jgi:hypothetical protein
MARSPVAIYRSLLLLFLVLCAGIALAQATPQDTSPNANQIPQPDPKPDSKADLKPDLKPNEDSKPAPQLSIRDAASQPAAATFDQVVDRAIEREHFFIAQMKHLHPLVETYLQNLKPDKDLGIAVPASDVYFLGRLDMSGGSPDDLTFSSPGSSKLRKRVMEKISGKLFTTYLPLGFAQMAILDQNFQRKDYDFTFVRREFLGEVRCIVMDVTPKKDASTGHFIGRVWVEDQDYNIVRFNGTYSTHSRNNYYFHFDSWRQNMRAGLWLPSLIYSEESDLKTSFGQKLDYKSQTRLWGYNLNYTRNSEFTEITIDAPQEVQLKDQSQGAQDASPVEAQRAWEHQAEINVLDRLQRVGLLAPEGEIDKVLQTVVNNMMVTNNLDIQPEVHCRVLLTTPLESFTIGHTIVISRGMIDVLPDEASLAMILTHELAHIVLGHHLNTKLAFNDRMFFPDERTFERMDFARDKSEEEAADKKALELLNNSPYKDKMGTAGLFLKAVQARAPQLKNLIRGHLGDSLLNGDATRMSSLMTSSPQFDPKKLDQIAALPLGGRVKIDPWTDQLELVKTKPVAITAATEKMPFEVTPFFPFLTRAGTGTSETVTPTPAAPNKETTAPVAAPISEKTPTASSGR